jgi:hypothetical protein
VAGWPDGNVARIGTVRLQDTTVRRLDVRGWRWGLDAAADTAGGAPIMTEFDYGYYWFRHHADASTFIACRDMEDGRWYMCGLGHAIPNIFEHATLLGAVPRTVWGGGSIDQ